LKVLAVTFAFSLLFFSQNAIADLSIPIPVTELPFSINIEGGSFDVNTEPRAIPNNLRVGSAIVSLPDGETGVIDTITILGPNKILEFGCGDQKVQNGTDLIKTCGGPAYLKAGETIYKASGSNFNPNVDVKLSINLFITDSNAFDPNT